MRDCPVNYGSVPDLHPPTRPPFLPSCDNPKCLQTLSMSPRAGVKLPLVESHPCTGQEGSVSFPLAVCVMVKPEVFSRRPEWWPLLGPLPRNAHPQRWEVPRLPFVQLKLWSEAGGTGAQ